MVKSKDVPVLNYHDTKTHGWVEV